MDLPLPKVLIIGAGPCGMSLLRAFKLQQKEKKRPLVEIFCYEIQEDWLGQWNYTFKIGNDQHGYPIPNSMYQGLWSNISKQIDEFPDYSFMEHFKGVNVSSYMPRSVWRDYLDKRFQRAGIKDGITFSTAVKNVVFKDSENKFYATMHDLQKDSYFQKVFDYVVVNSGHLSVPNYPSYKGFDSFKGSIIHAGNIRSWQQFSNKRILLVGSGASCEDLCIQLSKYKAKQISISYRSSPLRFPLPDSLTQFPVISSVKPDGTVAFIDGSQKQVDIIILCTGYVYSFPFMEDRLKLKMVPRLYPPLYNMTVFMDNPNVFYMGANKQIISFIMYQMQAYYVRDIIVGKQKLPSNRQMHSETDVWMKLEATGGFMEMLEFLEQQAKFMMKLSTYPHPNIDKVLTAATKTVTDRFKDQLTFYRDNVFQSSITGTISKMHPVRWIDNLDDSLQGFMKHFTGESSDSPKPKL